MNTQSKRGTFIHGVAASEHLDSSGERIIIKGMDISSLERGEGVLNWEHKNENASHIVGKILKAKKIFSEADCEDQNQLYFWKKGQAPFVYIVGELFDGVGHLQAKEIAAMLKYDSLARSEGTAKKNTINFSVEGAKLEKQNTDITKSIARKVTVTIVPCNKAAIAEELIRKPAQNAMNVLDGMFKHEESEEVQVLEKYDPTLGLGRGAGQTHSLPKAASKPAPKMAPATAPKAAPAATPKVAAPAAAQKTPNFGMKMGQTKSGKDVFSHMKTHEYKGFSPQDHTDAANMHYNAAQAAKSPIEGSHHMKQVQFHTAKAGSMERVTDRNKAQKMSAMHPGLVSKSVMGTTPGARVGNDALAKESLKSKIKKSVEENFETWPKAKELVDFISHKRPDLSKSEVIALAKVVAWKQFNKAEANLSKMIEPLGKPYVSEAQRKWAHTEAGKKALGGKKAVAHWDKASKGKKLPKKVSKKEKEICTPKKEMVAEHKHLVQVLDEKKPKALNQEKKKQSKELQEYKVSKAELPNIKAKKCKPGFEKVPGATPARCKVKGFKA